MTAAAPAARPSGVNAPPHHRLRRMLGRDPHESGRAATPLELIFDLTFVVAFAFTGNAVAQAFADGAWAAGLLGFGFATFAIVWAWINYSWFASAFDTDDWLFRLVTFVQMIGVIVFALGIPPLFASLTAGAYPDNRILVLGYVIMRLAMITQWLRAARQSPTARRACLTYVAAITIAQVLWVVQLFVHTSLPVTIGWYVILLLVELSGPVIAERFAGGTPWHGHHIAERYEALAIVALGEGIVGTVESVSAAVEAGHGFTWQVWTVALAGLGLTFCLWWVYFVLPSAEVLHVRRDKSFVWGYGHWLVFAAIAAVGAGLHVNAYYLEHHAHIPAWAAVATVAVPAGVYLLAILTLWTYLLSSIDPPHLVLGGVVVVGMAGPVLLAHAGVPVAVCLALLTVAPLVVVACAEWFGIRHTHEALQRLIPGEPGA